MFSETELASSPCAKVKHKFVSYTVLLAAL